MTSGNAHVARSWVRLAPPCPPRPSAVPSPAPSSRTTSTAGAQEAGGVPEGAAPDREGHPDEGRGPRRDAEAGPQRPPPPPEGRASPPCGRPPRSGLAESESPHPSTASRSRSSRSRWTPPAARRRTSSRRPAPSASRTCGWCARSSSRARSRPRTSRAAASEVLADPVMDRVGDRPGGATARAADGARAVTVLRKAGVTDAEAESARTTLRLARAAGGTREDGAHVLGEGRARARGRRAGPPARRRGARARQRGDRGGGARARVPAWRFPEPAPVHVARARGARSAA